MEDCRPAGSLAWALRLGAALGRGRCWRHRQSGRQRARWRQGAPGGPLQVGVAVVCLRHVRGGGEHLQLRSASKRGARPPLPAWPDRASQAQAQAQAQAQSAAAAAPLQRKGRRA